MIHEQLAQVARKAFWFGRIVARIEAELEGFARDLRELLVNHG